MKEKYRFVALLLLCVALGAVLFVELYRMKSDSRNPGKFTIVTSFYPIYIAVANVAGDCADVEVVNLSEPKTGCLHDFQLTAEDMKLLSSAGVFFVNGGGMENFLKETAGEYPFLRIAETTAGIMDLPKNNAHAWMSIRHYRSQIKTIAEVLCEMLPEHEEEWREHAADYDGKLAQLEEKQQELAEAFQGRPVILFHEAFEYVAEDYGFSVVHALNLDEERQIGAGEAEDAIEAANRYPGAVILAEELYGRDLAKMVQKEADAGVCYLDTLLFGDYSLDGYINGMQKNIELMQKAFGVK